MKLQKGQKIWIVFPTYSRNEATRGAEATVVKAGSKYATVAISTGKEYRFKRTVWEERYDNREVDSCNYFATIYESEAAWLESAKQDRMRSKFQDFCYSRPAHILTIEKIEKILEILEIKVD